MSELFTSLRGPVELISGKLMLRIPLEAGGKDLVACSQGIGVVEGDFLCIHIRDWLAEKLGIADGSTVSVDNADGKFNIRVCDTPAELLAQRRELERELNDLVDRRSRCETQTERLQLIPEAVRITGAMQRVEEEFEELTGQKMKEFFKSSFWRASGLE